MKASLDDLRILRLAQLYERAYESFVREIASTIVEPRTREKLRELVPETDDHDAILGKRIAAILAGLEADDRRRAERAALLAVVEVERAAREFYVANLDSLHDPALVDLFGRLATEEARHVRIAQAAVDLHEAAGRTPSP